MPSSPKVLGRWEDRLTFYNATFPGPGLSLRKEAFPTGRCAFEMEGNRIFQIHPDPSDSVWTDDIPLPDLRLMELRAVGETGNGRGRSLLLECEGYQVEMERIDLQEIEKFLRHFDPDVILSDDGDASLLPFLFSLKDNLRFPFPGTVSLIP